MVLRFNTKVVLIVVRRCCVLLVVDFCRCVLLPAAVWQSDKSVGWPSWDLSRVHWVCCAVQGSSGPRRDHQGPLGDSLAVFLGRHGCVGFSWNVLEFHTSFNRVEGFWTVLEFIFDVSGSVFGCLGSFARPEEFPGDPASTRNAPSAEVVAPQYRIRNFRSGARDFRRVGLPVGAPLGALLGLSWGLPGAL